MVLLGSNGEDDCSNIEGLLEYVDSVKSGMLFGSLSTVLLLRIVVALKRLLLLTSKNSPDKNAGLLF